MSHLFRTTLLALALFVIGATDAAAQKPGERSKVLLRRDRLAAQWDTVDCVKNMFKINPLLFLRGEIPLYYEHALTHNLSLEVAAGITYRNYINIDVAGDDLDAFDAGTEIIPKFSYHIGARYYFTDDIEPQGTYLQADFVHLDHSKNIAQKDSTGQFTGKKLLDQRVYNDLRLLFGYQRLGGNSNWLFDLYCGVAFRTRDMQIVHETLDLTNDMWSYRVEEKHDNVPAFFLGVKVGLGF